MCKTNDHSTIQEIYQIEDLPQFFKSRSHKISNVFSNKVIKISTIRFRSIENNTQEFSFKFELLTITDKGAFDKFQVKDVINFFKICLHQNKNFTVNINVSKASEELYNEYRKANVDKDNTVEEFIKNVPNQILLQGITIKLQANIKDINLDSLHQIEAYLEEKLKQAKNNEQNQVVSPVEPTQQKNVRNRQAMSFRGLFGCNLTSSEKQVIRASIEIAAMRDNVSWFRSLLQLPNFLSIVQFFLLRPMELSTQKHQAITFNSAPQEVKQNMVLDTKTDKIVTSIFNIDQTTSHTEYFKANRKKSKAEVKQTQEQLEEKQLTIKQAQNDAMVTMIDNQVERRGKKLDEIFVEVMSRYKNHDPEQFHNIFSSVFNIIYFQDKRLHEILKPGEISEVLEILEIPQPAGKSSFPREYLQRQVCRKKEQLLKLVAGIYIQQSFSQPGNIPNEPTNLPSKKTEKNQTPPPTNITLKSPLKIVFFSKETYFYLFVIGTSISILCLWHFPLGKVSILKELVPPGKKDNIGLVLNTGLPILTVLCVLSLACFIYSEYSIESVRQNKSISHT